MENSTRNREYFNFNRHERMTPEMVDLILDLIKYMPYDSFLKNALYGLFDGYYYRTNEADLEALKNSRLIDTTVYLAARAVFAEIRKWESN